MQQNQDIQKRAPIVVLEHVYKDYQVKAHPLQRLGSMWKNLASTVGAGPSAQEKNTFRALDDVSFVIRPGETVGIIGRNGSGKSTILQIIAGTLQATHGKIIQKGRVSALLELGAGFNPEFTGRENVKLSGAILGIEPKEMAQLFPYIEKFADIGAFIDQPVKTYSSGMYVRLAFAVAIHVSPDLLVVDEALAVGDTAFQSKCLTRIRRMQAEGVSILLVTHSMNTLLEYCDRGIYLKQGRLVMDGPCREVVKRYSNDLVDDEGGAVVYANDDDQADAVHQVPEASNSSNTQENTHDANPDSSGHTPVFGALASEHQARSELLSVLIMDRDGAPKNSFMQNEEVRISIRFVVNAPIDSPCFGIQLKSVDDIALWSGTTQNLQKHIAPLEPGEHMLEWKLRLNVGGGRYVLAVGIGDIDTGEYHRHSRMPYAGHLDVIASGLEGHGWLMLAPQLEGPVGTLR